MSLSIPAVNKRFSTPRVLLLVYLASVLYCFLIGVQFALVPLVALLPIFPILWAASEVFCAYVQKTANETEFRRWSWAAIPVLGSLFLAVLFFLMAPAFRLLDINRLVKVIRLFPLAVDPHPVTLVQNAIILLLTVGTIALLLLGVWIALSRGSLPLSPASPESHGSRLKKLILYALPCLIVWSFYLYAYWPGIMSPDSFNQWAQIDNLKTLYDWHPVVHTLLEYALTRLWYSPAIITIFQVLALAFAWAAVLVSLEQHRLPRPVLAAASILFALWPSNGILVVTLWKDILFGVVNLLLVLALAVVWLSDGKSLNRPSFLIALGALLAGAYLLRHNGLLILLLTPVALLACYSGRWKQILAASAVAAVLVLGLRNVLAFNLLKAGPNYEAVLYELPIHHINAVIKEGGAATTDERQVLETLAPIETWQKAYTIYDADSMVKPWGITQDPLILQKIADHKTGLMQVFIDFSLRYPGVIVKSEARMMTLLWRMTDPGDDYRKFAYDYILESASPGSEKVLHPNIFRMLNTSTPVNNFLDGYTDFTWKNQVTYTLFWRNGLYLFLCIAFALILLFTRGYRSLIFFVPVAANLLSLLVSLPVQDYRYIFPVVISSLAALLFSFARRRI